MKQFTPHCAVVVKREMRPILMLQAFNHPSVNLQRFLPAALTFFHLALADAEILALAAALILRLVQLRVFFHVPGRHIVSQNALGGGRVRPDANNLTLSPAGDTRSRALPSQRQTIFRLLLQQFGAMIGKTAGQTPNTGTQSGHANDCLSGGRSEISHLNSLNEIVCGHNGRRLVQISS